MSASKPASGIQTFEDGQAYIPSSRRADGSTRKEIKIRPGYKPPEDVEKYKSRNAETWRGRGSGGIPGVDQDATPQDDAEAKSKNAKRREAARKKKEMEAEEEAQRVGNGIASLSVKDSTSKPPTQPQETEEEVERQKKIRNQLKKLKAIQELKSKRATGEKLSADQLVKISKEQELVRDLIKLEYEGPEIEDSSSIKIKATPE